MFIGVQFFIEICGKRLAGPAKGSGGGGAAPAVAVAVDARQFGTDAPEVPMEVTDLAEIKRQLIAAIEADDFPRAQVRIQCAKSIATRRRRHAWCFPSQAFLMHTLFF